MDNFRGFIYLMLTGLLVLAKLSLSPTCVAADTREALVIDLAGPINPGMATFVTRGLEEAQNRKSTVVVIRLDTPGGLVPSMKTIDKAILNSSIPVIVYVAPSGAGAASAGVMITVAGHIAAMAPGTNIGAAHPVASGGSDIGGDMSEKVVNDMASYGRSIAEARGKNAQWVEKAIRESVSVTSEEALALDVIDLVARDMDHLFQLVHGKKVPLATGAVTLDTKDIRTAKFEPKFRDKVLKTVSDPNIAYLLMLLGLAGLYFEFSHPGAILPGVIGGISLVLAFYSMQTLPVNYAGFLLIILAVIFFIIEIKTPTYGILSIGGIISLTIGSIMLFEDTAGVSLSLIVPTAILVGAFFMVVAGLALKAHRAKPQGGVDGLVGEIGQAYETIDPEGLVFVHGEYWQARAEEKIEKGEPIEVESIHGLKLKIKKWVNSEL